MSSAEATIETMKSQEVSIYKTEDYLGLLMAVEEVETHKGVPSNPSSTTSGVGRISEEWRDTISEWATNGKLPL